MKTGARILATVGCLLILLPPVFAKDDTVTTAVYARARRDYQRERLRDGTFKPEYYALGNGGMVAGTDRDKTVEPIQYPEIAALVMEQLAKRNYFYAQKAEQATLLIVIHWGNTLPFNDINLKQSMGDASRAFSTLQQLKLGNAAQSDVDRATAELEQLLMQVQMQRMVLNTYVAPNARLLGYIEDINDSNDIRRLTGVGEDRYRDMMTDVEESRYYVIISAYDFEEVTKRGNQKLLWVTRVSVRAPGNRFDESVAAMLKNASAYFGRESGRLIRGEELRGRVELGDLKYLGVVKDLPGQPAGEGAKK
jgi:hypothetical protein